MTWNRSLWTLAALLVGCWDAHGRPPPPEPPGPCADAEIPTCAAQFFGPCGPWTLVAPVCAPDGTLRCEDAVALDGATPDDGTCRPFEDRATAPSFELTAGVPWNGRCAWLAQVPDGLVLDHAALVPEETTPFDGCPRGDWLGGTPRHLGDPTGDEVWSVLDAATVDGETLVAYRRYAWSESAPWPGLERLGSGFARWDRDAGTLRFEALVFEPSLDAGDALLWHDDALYALGCNPPSDVLHEDCVLARNEGAPERRDRWRFLDGAGGYGPLAEATTVFDSGPNRSSMRYVPGLDQIVHLYIAGFGDTVMMRTADRPEGPWSAARRLLDCDMPEDDAEAFCGSPAVRLERIDPRRPEQLAITYDVSTLAEDREARERARPSDYGPRFARVTP